MSEKISDVDYIKELERALMFLCECYVKASDSVGCRTDENGPSKKYNDLWFNFPQIQGNARFAVDKIAELRTPLGNREENKMTMSDIFERMHNGRKTEREISDEIRKSVEKINKKKTEPLS